MDYEKLYKETIDKLRKLHNDWDSTQNRAAKEIESVFPELRESEDERIKRCIQVALTDVDEKRFNDYDTTLKDCLAWLERKCEKTEPIEGFNTEFERQISHIIASVLNGEHEYNEGFVKYASQSLLGFAKKEQNHTDESKPKFKVGDWIVNNRDDYSREIMQIYDIRDCRYYFNDNIHFSWSVKECDEKCHLWTIQDAKGGDVLTTDGGSICIFDGTVEESKYPFAYCGLTRYGFESYDRNLPFTHDDVYPATKDQRDLLFQKMKEAGYEWDAEKKELKSRIVVWSEYDEKMWSQVINEMEAIKANSSTIFEKNIAQDKIDWIKSLKDRVQPQPEKEWSEEDERLLSKLQSYVEIECFDRDCNGDDLIDWIKSRIKSIKSNRWKPSVEQMEALDKAKTVLQTITILD